jgi:hypothetical protein
MSLVTFLYSLASVPMFAARPFLAAFLTALLARFGDDVPILKESDVVEALSHAPDWFTSGTTLTVLLALAVGEALSAKNPDVRAAMEQLDAWVKAGVSMAVSLALLDSETLATIQAIQRNGVGIESALALVVGAGTFLVAQLRRGALEIFTDIDDDDDIGLQTALSWLENAWTASGILFIVVFPVIALVLSALTALTLYALKRWKEHRELRARIPCAVCAAAIYPHATECHFCGHAVAAPRAVGLFGTPKDTVCEDIPRQRFDLIARKRCPRCATRLRERAVQQPCPTCKLVTFASEREFQDYLEVLGARLPKTLGISFALSAIPIVGVVPGVAYYRLTLISGLRGFVPPVRGCVSRIVLFFVRWILIALQPIPIVGALIIPLMCISSYTIYRRALVGRARKDLVLA